MFRTPRLRGSPLVRRPGPLGRSADMNVTPFIDVLLVLLVIFITAVPLTQQGEDVEIPPGAAPPSALPALQARIVAEYTADHVLQVNRRVVPMATAEEVFREIFDRRSDKTLFIIGDGRVRYGEIMRVIDAATGAGVTRVGIVTEGMRREAAGQ